ncbi:MAG: hypothetical protein CMJ78_15465 [Planctomycetaceae bacterium]|nr:hypothetical protein [Planctomycetaceae bacterium]
MRRKSRLGNARLKASTEKPLSNPHNRSKYRNRNSAGEMTNVQAPMTNGRLRIRIFLWSLDIEKLVISFASLTKID